MSFGVVIFCAFFYLLLLFFIAFYADGLVKQGRSVANNPYIYALSLAVYCTAWTYYGSVGRAAQTGVGFLPIYLGPTLFAPLSFFILKKIILISKAQRITSIADFISSRYGKSSLLGILVTIIAFTAIIPYIALQLKAITQSFHILLAGNQLVTNKMDSFGSAFYATIALTIFTIIFGTRNIDPNERHEGLVSAIAFESIVKLIAFLLVGIYVTYFLFDGFADIFQKATQDDKIRKVLSVESGKLNATNWFWLTFISFSAVICLPRQFHVSVVENTNPRFVNKSVWIFPLYLLLINIFVLPIALGGLLLFQNQVIDADTFVLELPLINNHPALSLLVFIGGISAATSMVVVETMAVSIMITNHFFMPVLISRELKNKFVNLSFSTTLLIIRRLAIVLVLALSYLFFKLVGTDYTLVSIGLISFVGVSQFFPILIGGIYWKRATKKGAIAGLIIGFLVWCFTLSLPTLADANIISKDWISNGLLGIPFLKPYSLFGMEGMDQISHSAFWSLFFNLLFYIGVSINTQPSQLELVQADYFVDISKYLDEKVELEVFRRSARVSDLKYLLVRFLGDERTDNVLSNFEETHKMKISDMKVADAELVNYIETQLAGALGASSAKIIIGSVVKEQHISFEEMVNILAQTQEILQYSKALEEKSSQLENTTQQLKEANEQLKTLDRLKADFITTVTHELRTPITSIKALSSILKEHKDIPLEKSDDYLAIIVNECDRITRLINQVLDLEKLPNSTDTFPVLNINIIEVIENSISSLSQLFFNNGIDCRFVTNYSEVIVRGDRDKLLQVMLNLLSNAIKFCDSVEGKIIVTVYCTQNEVVISVKDNGKGILKNDQQLIFEKFTQLNDNEFGKPNGSGLGLFITKRIVELHKGTIQVESEQLDGANFIVKIPYLSAV